MRSLLRLFLLRCRLALSKGPIVAFDIPSLGELQFIEPVVKAYCNRYPERKILCVHQGCSPVELVEEMLALDADRTLHVSRADLDAARIGGINLFLTSEQYDLGLHGTYSACMFHGQAAKGLSFVPSIVEAFDGFFFNGPIHKMAFEAFLEEFNSGRPVDHLDLFDVGYPKSDDLLNGGYCKEDVGASLGLDPLKQTILYAPAFNEGASLREFGPQLITALARETSYNVVVKLPIDCSESTSNLYATGGVDWFNVVEKLQAEHSNLYIYKNYKIDPLLACADVLVTCLSSVSFEFMALGKPVVFVDTPKFFSGYLKRTFPDKDTEAWALKSTVNGGKEFGLTVKSIEDLPFAIETVLKQPNEYPRQKERLEALLLYNAGKASEAAVSTVEGLISRKATSRRPCSQPGLLLAATRTITTRLRDGVRRGVKTMAAKVIQRHGYTLVKSGQGYIAAKDVVAAARRQGKSVCDYLETLESDRRKVGRRDRIISRMDALGVFRNAARICEIGAGTGMYLDKILNIASPRIYEIYETDRDWVAFLESEYGSDPSCRVICYASNGRTLAKTADGSIDLVHAHGVFVYLPMLQSLAYLEECVRVCKSGGYVVFDCYLDSTFSTFEQAKPWLGGAHQWPVILPKRLLDSLADHYRMQLVSQFDEIHASGFCNYIIWKKS